MGSFARAAAAGVAGTAAMTVSTALEMRVRGRPASGAPADAIGRLLGVEISAPWLRTTLSWGAHVPFGVALGAAREGLDRIGLREPGATAAFLAIAWLPDLAVVPLLGAADPPWRWPRAEVALSLMHHVAYALPGSLGWHAARER